MEMTCKGKIPFASKCSKLAEEWIEIESSKVKIPDIIPKSPKYPTIDRNGQVIERDLVNEQENLQAQSEIFDNSSEKSIRKTELTNYRS